MIVGDPEKRSSLDNVLKKIELRQQQIKPFTGECLTETQNTSLIYKTELPKS